MLRIVVSDGFLRAFPIVRCNSPVSLELSSWQISGLDLLAFWAIFWALGGMLVSRNGAVFGGCLEREGGFMILHSIGFLFGFWRPGCI